MQEGEPYDDKRCQACTARLPLFFRGFSVKKFCLSVGGFKRLKILLPKLMIPLLAGAACMQQISPGWKRCRSTMKFGLRPRINVVAGALFGKKSGWLGDLAMSNSLRTREDRELERLNRKRQNILKALEIKEAYKGSVVWERVRCGKARCHCRNGVGHGPYAYLHYYSRKTGKVQTKYLPKDIGELISCPKTELNEALCEIEKELEFLGQETRK